MSFSWSSNLKTAPIGFASCCVVLILFVSSFFEIDGVPRNIQYSLFAFFYLALGFAAFSLAREQSKLFGSMALVVGAMAIALPIVLFLWFPRMLRH